MKRATALVAFVIALLCLGGCWPKQVAWSPDGKQAIIVGSDGLYMCDAAGKLSTRLADGKFWLPTWLPDGKRFAVVQIGSDKDQPKLLYVAHVKDGKIDLGAPVEKSESLVLDIRPNPHNDLLAFTRGNDEHNDTPDLWVVGADGGSPPVLVEHEVTIYPDWTPDGKHLVYIHASGTPTANELHLATLVRRTIDTGATQPSVQGGQEELAGTLFSPLDRVRCLRDGRILFSAADIHLPTTKEDTPQHYSLFFVDPAQSASVHRALTASAAAAIPQGCGPFEVSPDGESVAITSGDNASGVILSLVTGKVRSVAIPPGCDSNGLAPIPAWRNADELCLVVEPSVWGTKDGRPEFVLLSKATGKCQVLSKGWPDAAMHLPK